MDLVKWIFAGLSLGALLLVPVKSCLAASRSAGPLEGYVWKNRLLLVFAPSASDTLYQAQMEWITGQLEGFVDRDLLLYGLSRDQHLGATPVSPLEAQRIRTQLEIPEDAFILILIGKDGGVKLRSEQPVKIEAIFGLIDGMPMRRQEMQEKAREE